MSGGGVSGGGVIAQHAAVTKATGAQATWIDLMQKLARRQARSCTANAAHTAATSGHGGACTQAAAACASTKHTLRMAANEGQARGLLGLMKMMMLHNYGRLQVQHSHVSLPGRAHCWVGMSGTLLPIPIASLAQHNTAENLVAKPSPSRSQHL